jgi:hypothetical protein
MKFCLDIDRSKYFHVTSSAINPYEILVCWPPGTDDVLEIMHLGILSHLDPKSVINLKNHKAGSFQVVIASDTLREYPLQRKGSQARAL